MGFAARHHPAAARWPVEDCLVLGRPTLEPVAIVAAHPDDETLGVGGRIARLRRLRLIHLTDGAPRDLQDARREGFATAADYARARRGELCNALRALGTRADVLAYDYPDQQAAFCLAAISRRLRQDLAHAHAVITHPYEHGHPDHDAAAFAVHAACALLRRQRGFAPLMVEFPSYHLRATHLVLGRFWPDSSVHEHVVALTAQERATKLRALECFATQRNMVRPFPVGPERYRVAPTYDFGHPAPPNAAVYDRFEWNMKSAAWRRHAAAAQAELGLRGPL